MLHNQQFGKTTKKLSVWTILTAAIYPLFAANAELRLPAIIGNNMVVQRGRPVIIWGWTAPRKSVTVAFAGNRVGTTSNARGKWTVSLPAMKAGGPYEMAIREENGKTIILKNILVGEVWLCSGQSNMNWPMKLCDTSGDAEKTKTKGIRLFSVPAQTAYLPSEDIPGVRKSRWTECNPQKLKQFSAVAFYFGLEIHDKLDVPVGLIQSSWSGTRIKGWIPLRGIATVPALNTIAKQIAAYRSLVLRKLPGYISELRTWAKNTEQAISRKEFPQPMPENPVLIHQNAHPTTICNAMIHPLAPFPIRGVIWYQGESNAADGSLYAEKMKALINGWRKLWGQGDFPFLFVQIPPCMIFYGKSISLPELWEAQTASLAIPNTGMAVVSDLVDVKKLHPENKKPVGKRLALLALEDTYGLNPGGSRGPLFKSATFSDGIVKIKFDHVNGGLTSRNNKPLTHFELAGANGKFVRAQAEIRNNEIVVSCDRIKHPVKVRFAWRNTAQPNLMNKSGLPASAFRAAAMRREKDTSGDD